MSNSSDIYKKKVVVLKFKEPDPSPSLHIRFYMRGKNEIFSLPMIFVELKKGHIWSQTFYFTHRTGNAGFRGNSAKANSST